MTKPIRDSATVDRRTVTTAAALGITGLLLPSSVAAASTTNPIADAAAIDWSTGELFDAWSDRTSASSDLGSSLGLDWQVFYAHRALTIANGTAQAYGIGTYLAGTNSWFWHAAISTAPMTLGSFGAPFEVGRNASSGNTSYTEGGFSAGPAVADLTVPAGRYFLIGLTNGPFYRAARTLAAPRTGQYGGGPAVTALNIVYRNATFNTPIAVPSQLGGDGTGYTQRDGHSLVASFRFSVTA